MFIYFSVRLIDGGCALRAEVKTPSIRENATIDTLEPGAPYKLKILRIVHVLLALSLLYFFLLFDSLHLFTDCLFSFFHVYSLSACSRYEFCEASVLFVVKIQLALILSFLFVF